MDTLFQLAAPLMAEAFTLWGSPTTWLEVVAFVLSLWMVGCNMRVHSLGWPLAMISSLLYALLFAQSKLFGEASLQLFFVAVSAWGWWQWLKGRGDDGGALKVHRLSRRQQILTAAGTLAAWPLLGLALARFTSSDVPYFDALPTVASITGQVLLGRKLIDNWPVWLAVNLVSIALFAHKALWLTVVLYAIFAVLSVAGWRTWNRLEGHVDARH
ncbi:nicotinamide riboside transporter PnuC [Ideonella sp. DXS29W]|uniref:Nicotinamide riboside transporter PnuC n=1 Tax=Ideonella lacteola TaxID=2984193 RepID=A0ABU9BIS0_9BURK